MCKDTSNGKPSENGNDPILCENFMTSRLCSNKGLAKLGDLLWCQGDTTLCTIHPQVCKKYYYYVKVKGSYYIFILNKFSTEP